MKFQQWNVSQVDAQDVERLMEAGYPYLVASVLSSRGVHTAEQAADFLDLDNHYHRLPYESH